MLYIMLIFGGSFYWCQQSVAAALSASPAAVAAAAWDQMCGSRSLTQVFLHFCCLYGSLMNFGRLASRALMKALSSEVQCLTEMLEESLVTLLSSV